MTVGSTPRLDTIVSGTQAFVDESQLISVPYTTIVGRAKIPDIANDLKASFGVERIPVQQITQVQNEFGPNSELVFAAVNDSRGLIRFVGGGWTTTTDTSGYRANTGTVGDYVEITFYGTGLNFLSYPYLDSRDWRASIDGGAEGSNLCLQASSILLSRNYNPNCIVPVASGLTLGVHTIKIRLAVAGLDVFGFEVLSSNTSGLININPGVCYSKGATYTNAISRQIAYNTDQSGTNIVTGVKGGRVVRYINSDNTISTLWNPVDTTTKHLSNADHSNEEVARTYHWREFGQGRTDDFSCFSSASASNLTFTLEDGVTTLLGNQLNVVPSSQFLSLSTNGSYLQFTFIGTGLDLLIADTASGGNDSYTYKIDAGTAQAWPYTSGNSARRFLKIVSGLPYGTHTFRMDRVTASTFVPTIIQYIVYQPKKPTVPANALEIADYNIMATYVANSVNGLGGVGTGVVRKFALREWVFVGTWGIAGAHPGFEGGSNGPNTITPGSYVEYSFFGTGVEIGHQVDSNSINYTISIDSSTNLSGYSTSLLQPGTGLSLVPSTGIVSGTSSPNGRVRVKIAGLNLGVHKVRVTFNSGSSNWYSEFFDIITPVHTYASLSPYIYNNTLPIGSMSLLDCRALEPSTKSKNTLVRTRGVSTPISATTVLPTWSPIPDMAATIKTRKGPIKIHYGLSVLAPSQPAFTAIIIDGVTVSRAVMIGGTNQMTPTTDSITICVEAGVHHIAVVWSSLNAQTISSHDINRCLLVEEV